MLGIGRFKVVVINGGVDVTFVAEKLYCFSGEGGREERKMEGEREGKGDRKEVNKREREK